MGAGDATIATGRASEEVVGAEQTSDKCLLGGWLEDRDGFALEGRKEPFWGA